jgi:tetratricopeptide (TPR) repeat protein
VTGAGLRSALAALDAARPAIARLDESRHAEDNAADLIDAWDSAQVALRGLSGVASLTGHALIREARQRNVLTLDQAHALVEFSAASERARDTGYTPTSGDLSAARTGFQQLDVAMSHPEARPAPAVSGPSGAPPVDPLSAPPPMLPTGVAARRNSAGRMIVAAAVIAVVAAGGFIVWRLSAGASSSLEAGRRAYSSGDRTAAYEQFERAGRADPRLAEPHIFLGRMYREDGRRDLASQELKRAIELEPANPVAQREMGAFLLSIGNDDLARRFYVRAVELDPSDRNAMGFLGCTLLRLGRFDEGTRFLQRAGQGSWSACAAAVVPPPAPAGMVK